MSSVEDAYAGEAGPVDLAALQDVARRKVRLAMVALRRPPEAAALDDEPDVLVQAAVERLRAHVRSLAAIDHAGLPMSDEQLVRLVIGPLAERSRDADTTAALLTATAAARPATAASPTEPVVSPPTLILDRLLSDSGYRYLPASGPAAQATVWQAEPPRRESRVRPTDPPRIPRP